MKKSLMLLFATVLVAIMAGCGGGGSSAKSKASAANTDTTTTTDQVFNVDAEETTANVTYKTTAKGDFPPAPPSSSLSDAQDAANKKL